MTKQSKLKLICVVLSGVFALTACTSNTQELPKPAASATPEQNAPAPEQTPAHTQPPAQTNPTNLPSVSVPEETNIQLKEILEFAKVGKIPGVEYAAHSNLIDEVEEDWGKPDKQESAGKGLYATFSKKNVVIGFNKGSKIFDVRSSDPKLQELTLTKIENYLGKANEIKVNGDDTIYIYNVNEQFQLKFIIPKSTNKVDHISVFSPQDSINLMAG